MGLVVGLKHIAGGCHPIIIAAMKFDRTAVALCCSAVASQIQQILESSTTATVAMLSTCETGRTMRNGRYLKGGSIPTRAQSVWYLTDTKGDEQEFLHFTGMTRKSFDDLVAICNEYLDSNMIKPGVGKKKKARCKRRKFRNRDIVAIALKFLLSNAELKNLHVQFGSAVSTFNELAWFGIDCFVVCVGRCDLGKVFWDRSEEHLSRCAERTKLFLDISGVVAMVDGDKLGSKSPSDHLLQNRDYNGWTKDVNRNVVLVWDVFGKIVDAAVNAPGTFHDSRTAWWCKIYDRCKDLPKGYKCCCDDAFYTKGELMNKLVKTKEEFREGELRSNYDQQLTHLRQCSEWGNQVLTGTFRILKGRLPTDNVKRAKILWACIYLHNWRTETVARNQITTYFNNLEKD